MHLPLYAIGSHWVRGWWAPEAVWKQWRRDKSYTAGNRTHSRRYTDFIAVECFAKYEWKEQYGLKLKMNFFGRKCIIRARTETTTVE
jgi:hypothetical protein